MTLLFTDAFDLLGVGSEVRVHRDEAEPRRGTDLWKQWRHRNHQGKIVGKVDGPPRAILVQLPEEEIAPGVTSAPTYEVLESDGAFFEELREPAALSAAARGKREKARERTRLSRLPRADLIRELEAMMDARIEAALARLKGGAG
jgi:hypothetical protein